MRISRSWRRAFQKIDRAFDIGSSIYLVLVISLFIFLGFAGIMIDYGKIGQSESLNFIWEMIGFCFVLAALLLSINKEHLQPIQRKFLPVAAFGFVLAGILIIISFGVITFATNAITLSYSHYIKIFGLSLFVCALFLLSSGISVLLIESIRSIKNGFGLNKK